MLPPYFFKRKSPLTQEAHIDNLLLIRRQIAAFIQKMQIAGTSHIAMIAITIRPADLIILKFDPSIGSFVVFVTIIPSDIFFGKINSARTQQ